jgi:hypothetical protein
VAGDGSLTLSDDNIPVSRGRLGIVDRPSFAVPIRMIGCDCWRNIAIILRTTVTGSMLMPDCSDYPSDLE